MKTKETPMQKKNTDTVFSNHSNTHVCKPNLC